MIADESLKITKNVDSALSALGLGVSLKGAGGNPFGMHTVPEDDQGENGLNSNDEEEKEAEDEEEEHDLDRAQVSTRGLNKGIIKPDENFNNDDLDL